MHPSVIVQLNDLKGELFKHSDIKNMLMKNQFTSEAIPGCFTHNVIRICIKAELFKDTFSLYFCLASLLAFDILKLIQKWTYNNSQCHASVHISLPF